MTDHVSSWDEDDDGWPYITCSCGWATSPLPDAETAGDVWGDHRSETTAHDILAYLTALASS
jgi:hypothetical protein